LILSARNDPHDRGFSQAELARRSGIHRVVISDIEARRTPDSVRSFKALAAALGVAIDDLVVR